MTKNRLARGTKLNVESAQIILTDLVNEGILDIVILVLCTNEEYSHPHWFYSLDDYYSAPRDMVCKECGAPLDFQNAKVGFQKGRF
ncbi:hypothetical protein AM501_03450 [Aneurinibacillus migulanus]|nr:hypothetical protein TS64_12435 [Aneurinibacillus migulanus]KPD09580.1 hypothetical protein AM501_03450 [Aneurinibacillus migulanus]